MAIESIKDQVSKRDETRTLFAGLILQRLRADGVTKAEFDSSQFVVRVFDGKGVLNSSLMLEQAFQEYHAAPADDKDEVLDRYLDTVRIIGTTLPPSLKSAAIHLLPRVAPRMMLEEMELSAKVQSLAVTASSGCLTHASSKDFGAHHCLSLVYDFPTHVVTLHEKTLYDWGTTFDEVREIAMRNLERMSEEPFDELCPGLYVSPFSDNHDSSRLLLIDKIRNECKVAGEHIALVLNRDTLLIADSANVTAMQTALAVASTTLQEPRPYSAHMLVLRGDKWQDFSLNDFHPAFDDMRQSQLYSAADMYGRQKKLLDTLHEKTASAIGVAEFMVLREPTTDELFSFGTWTEGFETLLPVTDTIVLIQPSKPENVRTMRCSFAKALEVVPHLMEPVGCYPMRYRVTQFPTEAQLELLRDPNSDR